jgi:hypothetical protein
MADHSITPPPELVRQWFLEWTCDKSIKGVGPDIYVANRAAKWGADIELEACCEWLQHDYPNIGANALRAARRPKPQTLNSIALEMLGTIERMDVVIPEITDTIRRALEQLDD